MLLVNPNQRPVADATLVVQAKLGDLQRHAPCETRCERAAQIVKRPMVKRRRLDGRTRLGMAAKPGTVAGQGVLPVFGGAYRARSES